MNTDAKTAIEMALKAGFSRAELISVRSLPELLQSPEANARGVFEEPLVLLPQARSVLVAAMPFHWFAPWEEENAEVSAFYFLSQRAHEAIQSLAEGLESRGVRVCAKQDLPQKQLAKDAGFGLIGRNTLLRNRPWGSCLTIRTLLTDIEPLDRPIEPMPALPCGECHRCVEACPTGALDGNGNLCYEKCLRAHMLGRDLIPLALREKMGVRLLGCEICQRACPHNWAVPMDEPDEQDIFAIDKLLRGERRDLDAIGRAIGWNEARLLRVQAQAAICAGNSGDTGHLAALSALCEHAEPRIREHARWAVAKLKGE